MCLAMIDAMKYWIQEVGVDGFRCDAADYVPYTFWKQAVDSLRAIPNRKLLMLAEGKRKDHFDAVDMNYAWDLMEAMGMFSLMIVVRHACWRWIGASMTQFRQEK